MRLMGRLRDWWGKADRGNLITVVVFLLFVAACAVYPLAHGGEVKPHPSGETVQEQGR